MCACVFVFAKWLGWRIAPKKAQCASPGHLANTSCPRCLGAGQLDQPLAIADVLASEELVECGSGLVPVPADSLVQ
eukprot:14963261-Alexandrium_andersonii.AAC.1